MSGSGATVHTPLLAGWLMVFQEPELGSLTHRGCPCRAWRLFGPPARAADRLDEGGSANGFEAPPLLDRPKLAFQRGGMTILRGGSRCAIALCIISTLSIAGAAVNRRPVISLDLSAASAPHAYTTTKGEGHPRPCPSVSSEADPSRFNCCRSWPSWCPLQRLRRPHRTARPCAMPRS